MVQEFGMPVHPARESDRVECRRFRNLASDYIERESEAEGASEVDARVQKQQRPGDGFQPRLTPSARRRNERRVVWISLRSVS